MRALAEAGPETRVVDGQPQCRPETIRTSMPEVSRFFGVALGEIETLALLRGELPRRALALVLEWAAMHRQELRADWEMARRGSTPASIAPLD